MLVAVLQNRVSLRAGRSISLGEHDDNNLVVIKVIEQGMFDTPDVSGGKVHSLREGRLGFEPESGKHEKYQERKDFFHVNVIWFQKQRKLFFPI